MSPQHQHAAYKAAQHNASKCRQVVMLYEGAINYVRKAIQAINDKDIQKRYNNLDMASKILLGLQSALDFDNGGDVANILDQYYHSLDMRLLTVHRNNSIEICEQVIKELVMMRDAWDQIDKSGGSSQLDQQSLPFGDSLPSLEAQSTAAVTQGKTPEDSTAPLPIDNKPIII